MTKYKRAGAHNYSDATAWSTTSGGANDTTAPTAADDVILDSASGNLTLDGTPACRSFNCARSTNYAGVLTHTAGVTLSIGDGTAGLDNVAIKLASGMTYTLGNATTSAISLISTSTTEQSVDFAGKTTGNITYNGVNGKWKHTGTQAMGASATATLTNGSLDYGTTSPTLGIFNSNNTNVRTLKLGSGTITVAGANGWNVNNSNLTFDAGTSLLKLTFGFGSTLTMRALTYYNIEFNPGGNYVVDGSIIANNINIIGSAAKTNIITISNSNWTVNGTLTITGNSTINRLLIRSNSFATARTITCANPPTISNTDFRDITGAGAGSWDISAATGGSGDCGGNSGITFTTPVAQTCTMSVNKNHSDVTIWTSRIPLPQDPVSMANVTGGTLTADMVRLGGNIDWTGATGSPTWAFSSVANEFCGSIKLVAGLSITGTQTSTLSGRGAKTIDSKGIQFSQPITIDCGQGATGGTYTMNDALSCASAFTITSGVFVTQGFDLVVKSFSGGNNTPRTFTPTTTRLRLTDTAATTLFSFTSTSNLTADLSLMTIVIDSISANTRTIATSGLVYGGFEYILSGSTGGVDFTGGGTFSNFSCKDASNARTIRFTAGTTTTILGKFDVNGGLAKLITISSITAATHTLTKPNGIVSCQYLSVTNSIAAGSGSAWYAGSTSTNGGGNTGWIFSDAPVSGISGKSTEMLLGV